MRVIKYLPKTANADTQYRECDPEDLRWIQTQLILWLATMSELDQLRDEDSVWVRDQWWHKRSNKLHKGKNGPNSPCSVVGGILQNLMFKQPAQRDLTNKQMEDLEYISAILGNCYENITAYRFQIGFSTN